MPRIPVLKREEMDAEQQRVHDAVLKSTGRVGQGPAIAYAYAARLWEIHDASSGHFKECSLSQAQVRMVSLMTARHWNAAFPWTAQAKGALAAGVAPSVVGAINARQQPDLADATDKAVHAAARELLETGTLADGPFKAAVAALGYQRLADVVGVIGHFTATAMMANLAGAEVPADAPSTLKV